MQFIRDLRDVSGALKELVADEARQEEDAKLEQVNEVKVARAARRERITRMRLARSLAVAMLGAAVMATSAAGMAFASFLEDRARAAQVAATRHERAAEGAVA